MNTNQLELLCCPECNTELELLKSVSANKFNLHCENCSKDFVGNENFIDFRAQIFDHPDFGFSLTNRKS